MFDKKRYIGIYGGRGSGKSHFCALYCLIKAIEKERRIACIRVVDKGNNESGLTLLNNYIKQLGIEHIVNFSNRKITFFNGSEIMFFGANNSNHQHFKSTEGLDLCWLDEAAAFSYNAIKTISPTVRHQGSQLIFSWNPSLENDPCKNFLEEQASFGDRVLKIKANYYDNPFLSKDMIEEAESDRQNNYHRYLHIWEGEPAIISDQLIYSSIIKEIEFDSPPPNEVNYIIGVDWGYTEYAAAVRAFMRKTDAGDELFIDYESYKKELRSSELKGFFDKIPYSKTIKIIADANSPLMIAESSKIGYRIKKCEKNSSEVKGVIDGIDVLRNLAAINIHPRCKNLLREMKGYRWQTKGDEILMKVVKKDDHGVDALRYACENYIKRKNKENSQLDKLFFI